MRLHYVNVYSTHFLAVLGVNFGIEGNFLTLFKGFEAVSLDCGKMYKYIFAAVIVSNKAKTFVLVKPFYSTVIH